MMSESAEPLLGSNSATTADSREDDDGSESESRLALSEQHGAGADTLRSLSLTTEEEFFCGCGPCYPPWLQWLKDARVFTALLCLFSTIEGALVSGNVALLLGVVVSADSGVSREGDFIFHPMINECLLNLMKASQAVSCPLL